MAYVETSNFRKFVNLYEKFLMTEAIFPAELSLDDLNIIEQPVNNIYVWKATHGNNTKVYYICARIVTN